MPAISALSLRCKRSLSPAPRALLAALVLFGLSACATPTPYQPVREGFGYSEQRLESNRFRVRFSGNSKTPRDAVENYVNYRAAELTLDNGYDYFVVTDHATNRDPKVGGGGSSVGLGVGGSTGSFGSGLSIGLGTVFGGGGGDSETYNTQLDVLMFKGERPAGDLKALDAHEVKATLEPQIQRAPAKN